MKPSRITWPLLAFCCIAEASLGVPNAYPLYFERTAGQTATAARFVARGPQYSALIASDTAIFQAAGSALRLTFVGAKADAEVVALEPLDFPVHYLIGVPESWRTNVAAFGRLQFCDIYPGIDLVYYSDASGRLEYDLRVKPGGDPQRIRVRLEGGNPEEDVRNEMVVRSSRGEWRHSDAFVYQVRDGKRRRVQGRLQTTAPGEGWFQVGAYDRSTLLIIDPTLTFSTYLGGSGQSAATSIALDSAGNTYVTGWTETLDWPGAWLGAAAGARGVTAYVAKLSASGKLSYMTYLGGNSNDRGYGIAVDRDGCAIVAGWTHSTNFPVINAAQPLSGGGRDGFAAKLSATGNALVFSTYIGGKGADSANAVALDPQGEVYIAGQTTSTDFVTMNALQPQSGGGDDAFIVKLSATGMRRYSTFLGGRNDDRATGIAVDGWGAAYVTGGASSANFPVLNAFQWIPGGQQDAFAAKISSSGSSLVYSTYLGGAGGTTGNPEIGNAIAVDANGYAYIAGVTGSPNFPVLNPWQSQISGAQDSFVLKLNPAGNALVYSTYIGGSSIDVANAIAVDSAGRAHVGGYTASLDFPVTDALQSSSGGAYDAFLVTLSSSGNSVERSTYFGGADSDCIYGIAVDAAGTIYIAGQTLSNNFPIANAVQTYKIAALSTFVSGILPASAAGLRFVPVTPCRLVDTRNGIGPFGGPAIPGKSIRTFVLTGSGCGAAANAQAFSLNITVIPASSLGYLTVWAAGQGQPGVSTLNSLDGRIKAAATIVPAGYGGAISIYASDTTHVLVDINGYFVPANVPGALAFYPVAPCRVADTRIGSGALGGPSLAAYKRRTLPVLSGSCAIPASAQAYSLSFTAAPNGPLGFISTWPTGAGQPTVSTLNALTGALTANAAIVPAGLNGSIEVFATNDSNVLVDINGYFAPAGPGGLSLYNMPGCRILDTRLAATGAPITGGFDVQVSAAGCNVPASAHAVVVNATVVPIGSLGFLTLWASGRGQPGVSTLNALDGAITSNLAIVPAANGRISGYVTNATHVLLDASGYFAP